MIAKSVDNRIKVYIKRNDKKKTYDEMLFPHPILPYLTKS